MFKKNRLKLETSQKNTSPPINLGIGTNQRTPSVSHPLL